MPQHLKQKEHNNY